MGAKKKAAAAGSGAVGAAKAARDNPYVQRIVEDDELRDNLQAAYESARDAYGRISSSKKPAKALIDDKKLQRDLKAAADSIREAAEALREAPKRSKPKSGGGFFRKVLVLGLAAGLALALSEDLRKKVLDALFGAEEEFEYTSTTTSAGAGATGGVTAGTAGTAGTTAG